MLALALTWLTASLDIGLTGQGWRTTLQPENRSGYRPGPTSLPRPDTLQLAWLAVDDAPLTIAWTGCVLAADAGLHRFLIRQAGTSRLVIDGRRVDLKPQLDTSSLVVGEIDLDPGAHGAQLVYEPWLGAEQLQLWLQRPGGVPRRIEDESKGVAPRCLSREWSRLRPLTSRLPVASVVAWTAVALLTVSIAGLALARRLVPDPGFWQGLGPWLAGAVVVSAWGLWWGLPASPFNWAADEIDPWILFRGLDRHFAAPWAERYPPVHYYVLSLAAHLVEITGAPVGIDPHRPPGVTLLHVSMRLISVVMATGALIAVGALAHRGLGRLQGRLAMLSLLVSPTWLYYAKVANVDVPYVFWLAWALVAFIALVEHPTVWTAVGLGFCAACAVGTKDQAVGFFVLMPVALLGADVARRHRMAESAPWLKAAANPAWLAGLAVAAATLALIYQWPVNSQLARGHLALTQAARYPPMADASVAGYVGFWALVARQVAFTMGWPVFALALGGLVLACARRRPPVLAWLLVPMLSYVVFFIALARYSYDRFLLGVILILSLFSAHAAARLLSLEQPWRRATQVVLAAALAYSAGYGLTANQMMVRDARVAAEQFLRDRAGPGDTVAFIGWRQYVPRLADLGAVEVAPSTEALQTLNPTWLVLNERFAQRLVDQEGAAQFLSTLKRGDLGCAPVFAGPSPLSWWAFAQYSEWLRQPGESGYIILDKVNPPVVVYSCASEAVTGR